MLSRVGLAFEVRPADIDEVVRPGEAAVDYVRRLSIEKAEAVERSDDEIVVAADTTVVIDGRILGKPSGPDEARSMLSELSGRTHRVHTAVTVVGGSRAETTVVTTRVTFAEVGATAIQRYVDIGESMDKAGAYAIQGAGAALVSSIEGSAPTWSGSRSWRRWRCWTV